MGVPESAAEGSGIPAIIPNPSPQADTTGSTRCGGRADAPVTDEARRITAGRCLIAADVDRTVLSQDTDETSAFFRQLGPELARAASVGAHLALVTGNSMHQLGSRLLRLLLTELARTDSLAAIGRFHFFCNAGGVYARFPPDDLAVADAIGASAGPEAMLEAVTERSDGQLAIRPRFIDAAYVERVRIPDPDLASITEILEAAAATYFDDLERDAKGSYSRRYDLEAVRRDLGGLRPSVEHRPVSYTVRGQQRTATVQVTLKPVLSFRYARKPGMFDKDLRRRVTKKIQARLDRTGLGHYVARPGGRSSIDVTLEKLDKAYALEFLIDRLNLQGSPRQGGRLGSNAIYFGDEVIVGGGNDYPVTRIPGLLVVAVNPDRELVPFRSTVLVPAVLFDGPDATAEVLTDFNRSALELQREYRPGRNTTALQNLKAKRFADRVHAKIPAPGHVSKYTPDQWQALHAFVTLLNREDPVGRGWLSILIDQLDSIMEHLAVGKGPRPPGAGTSHIDG